MFKKLQLQSGQKTQLKSSVVRQLRTDILATYPYMIDFIDDILPKKGPPVVVVKCSLPERTSLVTVESEVLFFQPFKGAYYPTLRLLHKYPDMMQKVRVDRGAIPFVLKGANIMCRGLTSPGGDVSADLPAGTPVAVYAEGKEHALGVGILTMSTEEIRTVNDGMGIENYHDLNDALWKNEME